MRSVPRVKQISFKEKEHRFLLQQMEDLMDLYKMDISGLYKTLLREKHQAVFGSPSRSQSATTGVMSR